MKLKEAAIECKNITKSYGDNETRIAALKGINIDILLHELTLLVGPSGSGKTTLLSIIMTILTPDNGELVILGKEVLKMDDQQRAKFCQKHLGIVFQSLFLIPTLTILENVSLPLLLSGLTQQEAEEKSYDVLKKLNIANRSHSFPQTLSKGQQQRVAIGRAIVNDADIIVCDEPTSALDHNSGIEIMTILRELANSLSKAVLVVTHDHRIFSFADRIIEISDGQIISGQNHA